MNINILKKLKKIIEGETKTQNKKIIPGNVRLSFGMYRTPEEQEKYVREQNKKYEKYSKQEERQYKKYLKKN
jgi:hypothetical protein